MGALTTYEHGHHRVAEVAVAPLPLGHHGEQPAVEVLLPRGEEVWYATGHLADVVVLTVLPFSTAFQELVHGVVVPDERRLHVELDVYRPGCTSVEHLLVGDAVQFALRQRAPGPLLAVLLAELLLALHLVVAQFEATVEEVAHLRGDALLLRHLRHRLSWFRLFIDGAEELPDLLDVHVPLGIGPRTLDGRLLGQS